MKKRQPEGKSQAFLDQYTEAQLLALEKKRDTPEQRALLELGRRVIANIATPEEEAEFEELTKDIRAWSEGGNYIICEPKE